MPSASRTAALRLLLAAATILPPLNAVLVAQTPSRHAASDSLVDINAASPEQLLALPGMGREYVRRVIAGRPYRAKNDLVRRGVLPQDAYAKMSALIVAHRVQPAISKP